VVPIADTVKRIARGVVVETLPRDALAAAQTPQAFRLGVLREALEKAERDGFAGTDCASLVERLGVPVRACAGRAENFKVTDPRDLERARALLLGGAPA
jgi:2-C-methyl-D-erythritol 4-phosphate cytidylyltransferase